MHGNGIFFEEVVGGEVFEGDLVYGDGVEDAKELGDFGELFEFLLVCPGLGIGGFSLEIGVAGEVEGEVSGGLTGVSDFGDGDGEEGMKGIEDGDFVLDDVGGDFSTGEAEDGRLVG